MIGNSTDPHVSAAQCTIPDPKSAVIIPHSAETTTTPTRSTEKYRMIKIKSNIIKLMHAYTQTTSCARFPAYKLKKKEKKKNKKKCSHVCNDLKLHKMSITNSIFLFSAY